MACASYMAAERSAASASRRLTGFAAVLLTTAALVAVAALLPSAAHAQDATWRNVPGSPDFNTAANWTPATVPTGTAFFGTSNTTALSFSANTTIGGWTFNAGASNYSFSNGQTVVFTGTGIVVNGGSATIVNNNFVLFSVDSSAGNTTIINKAGAFNNFVGASTAGNAIITNDVGGSIRLGNFATAGNAVITNNGLLQFQDFSTAGNAAITNKPPPVRRHQRSPQRHHHQRQCRRGRFLHLQR